MIYQTYEVKQDREEIVLLKEIAYFLKKKAAILKKTIRWFRFAKKTKNGFVFLRNKDKQWKLLEEIVEIIAKKHKKYTTGQIVDKACDLVNTTVADYIHLSGLSIQKNISQKERSYLKKLIIEICDMPAFVPSKPWIMFGKRLLKNKWKAKDLVTKKITVIVKKTIKGFSIFKISS